MIRKRIGAFAFTNICGLDRPFAAPITDRSIVVMRIKKVQEPAHGIFLSAMTEISFLTPPAEWWLHFPRSILPVLVNGTQLVADKRTTCGVTLDFTLRQLTAVLLRCLQLANKCASCYQAPPYVCSKRDSSQTCTFLWLALRGYHRYAASRTLNIV